MIHLSGDVHEGGGQILRTALALSARCGLPFTLERIRAGRKKPGLQAQHLACVRLAQQMCDAEVRHAELNSQRLEFYPDQVRAGEFDVDIGTAGSVTLLLQAALWAVSGPCRFRLRGGTDVPFSPPLDYLLHVTLPCLGVHLKTHTLKRAFNPKGGGEWIFEVEPATQRLNLIDLPESWTLHANVVAARELAQARVGERVVDSLKAHLTGEFTWEYVDTRDVGVSCTAWAVGGECRQGATLLGERGKSSERLGQELAEQLLDRLSRPQPVDEHLADQLVPQLALQGGQLLCQEITPHVLANIAVVEAFLGPRIIREENLVTVTSP